MDDSWTDIAAKTNESVADIVRRTVTECMRDNFLPGYVFHEHLNLYYNAETSYYYDQNTSLFYHTFSRCYYYYDEETKSYILYSRLPTNHHWSSKSAKVHARSIFGEIYMRGMPQEEVDVFEVVSHIIVDICHTESLKLLSSQADEVLDEIYFMIQEERLNYAACIRLIEASETYVLHVITISGANIGNLDSCDVKVETFYSKCLEIFANITYDEDYRRYVVTAATETVPISVNDQLMSERKSAPLEHLDELRVGSVVFVAHIHHGSNTCPSCEPGLLNERIKSKSAENFSRKVPIEVLRRRELKKLKAEYSLTDIDYIVPRGKKEHRKISGENNKRPSGSSSIYGNCLAKPKHDKQQVIMESHEPKSSIAKPLDNANKGYKLLQAIGWNSGEGLGRQKQGTIEPIGSIVRTNRSGLGWSEMNGVVSRKLIRNNRDEAKRLEKLRVAQITKERFDVIEKKGK